MPTDIIPFAVEHTEIEGLKLLRMKQISAKDASAPRFGTDVDR